MAAYALVPLLLEPAAGRFREAWVAHAQRITVRRLGDDVERALAQVSRSEPQASEDQRAGQFAPPPLEPGAEPSKSDLEPDASADPAGLQTGALSRLEKESERLVFLAAPEVGQLFRSVLARSSRRSNLTTLCWWHHKVGIHGHVLRCTGTAPDRLRFELGLRPDGPPLAVYRSADVRA